MTHFIGANKGFGKVAFYRRTSLAGNRSHNIYVGRTKDTRMVNVYGVANQSNNVHALKNIYNISIGDDLKGDALAFNNNAVSYGIERKIFRCIKPIRNI